MCCCGWLGVAESTRQTRTRAHSDALWLRTRTGHAHVMNIQTDGAWLVWQEYRLSCPASSLGFRSGSRSLSKKQQKRNVFKNVDPQFKKTAFHLFTTNLIQIKSVMLTSNFYNFFYANLSQICRFDYYVKNHLLFAYKYFSIRVYTRLWPFFTSTEGSPYLCRCCV